jgi:hypothetical protein
VEGTETRVNAQSEAYEYIVDFGETSKVAELLSGRFGQCLHARMLCCKTYMGSQQLQRGWFASESACSLANSACALRCRASAG